MEIYSIGYTLLGIQKALLDVVTPELRAVIVDFDKVTPELYVRFYFDGKIPEKTLDLWEDAITEASAGLGPDCQLNDAIVQINYPIEIPFRGRYAYLRKEDNTSKNTEKLNKSILTTPDLQKKIQQFYGPGKKINGLSPKMPGYKEFIDFDEFIGYSINRITGDKIKTCWGMVHYERDGIHIVPAFHGHIKELNKRSPISYAMLAMQNALLGVVTPELRAVIVDYCDEKQLIFIRIYYDGEISEELSNLWEGAIMETCADLGSESFFDTKSERIDFPNKIPFRGRYAYLREE